MNFEKALSLYKNDKTLQILRAEHFPLQISFFIWSSNSRNESLIPSRIWQRSWGITFFPWNAKESRATTIHRLIFCKNGRSRATFDVIMKRRMNRSMNYPFPAKMR
jgi:hypothetical protein